MGNSESHVRDIWPEEIPFSLTSLLDMIHWLCPQLVNFAQISKDDQVEYSTAKLLETQGSQEETFKHHPSKS